MSRANYKRCHVARSGFGSRFRYILWLRYLETGEPPVQAAIGRGVAKAAGLPKAISGQAVGAWMEREVAPDGRRNTSALAVYLEVPEPWLIDGEGEAPRRDLWAIWSDARAVDGAQNAAHVPVDTLTFPGEIPSTKGGKQPTTTRRVVGTGRPGKSRGGR